MAGLSPTELTGRFSIGIALFAALIFFIFSGLPEPQKYFYTIVVFASLLLVSFLTLRYTLLKFIQENINNIYNTIYQLKRDPRKKLASQDPDEAIKHAQEDVRDWYLDNKKEVDRLKDLENYRREFIGNVSHELKTPVFNIQGYLLTLLEGGLEDDTINRKFLERAEKSVEKLIKLLNELDMIIRLDTSDPKLNILRVNLIEVVKDSIEALELKAKDADIEIQFEKKNPNPIYVNIDEDKIGQVITNLLSNSIKYGVKDGLITIGFKDLNEKVLVEIKDNGIGVSKEDLSHIFDRFYRTDIGRSKSKKGFGLGLSIVKHIIDAHRETIQVSSEEGKGSIFSFTLTKSKN